MPRVLVVDDDPTVREVVVSYLRAHGHQVTVHVRRLREKVEPDPRSPTRLVTVWGPPDPGERCPAAGSWSPSHPAEPAPDGGVSHARLEQVFG